MPLRYSRRVVSNAVHELSPWISHLTCPPGYTPFTPSKSGQRLPPTYYRGCWHVVSRGLFVRYRLLLVPDKRSLQPESLLPSRGVAGSGLRPLPNIPHCCLPWESGPCLSPNVAGQPLSPATDRRLGGPLPRQLSNQTRVHLRAINLWQSEPCDPTALCGISTIFTVLFPTPRQVPHALLTRPPLSS